MKGAITMRVDREMRGAKKALNDSIDPKDPTNEDYEKAYKEATLVAKEGLLHAPVYVMYAPKSKKLIIMGNYAFSSYTGYTIVRIFIRTIHGIHQYTFKEGAFL